MGLDLYLLVVPLGALVLATAGFLYLRHESKRLDREQHRSGFE